MPSNAARFIRPPNRLTVGPRAAAGAMGGIVGGLLFAAMLYGSLIFGNPELAGRGVLPALQALLGTGSSAVVFTAHIIMSVVFGLVFATFISPRDSRASLVAGLVYGALVWLFAGFLATRILTSTPLVMDSDAVFNLIGHLVYGLGLGVVYAAFSRLEIKEALDSDDPGWREWGAKLAERRR